MSLDAAIRHIHAQWHDTVVRRDIEGLMALNADDAVFESPLVWAALPEGGTGILEGKPRSGISSIVGSARRRTAWAAGTARASSSPTGSNWRGNTRARRPTAIRST